MGRSFCSRLAAVALVLAFVLLSVTASAQVTRRVYVSVVDAAGAPVTDLTDADVLIRENDVPRKVTGVALATDPMLVALVVDSGEGVGEPIGRFREGLTSFVDGLPDGTEVGLISVGRQARARLQPTADRKRQRDVTQGFFGDGGGAALLDGMLEAESRFFRKAANRRPVIVIVTTDYASAGTQREDIFDRFVQQMRDAGTAIHGVVLSLKGGGTPTVLTLTAVQGTGGRYEAIAAPSALQDKLAELAAQLTSDQKLASTQYMIEYVSEGGDRGRVQIEIGVTRSNVKLTSSTRLPVR